VLGVLALMALLQVPADEPPPSEPTPPQPVAEPPVVLPEPPVRAPRPPPTNGFRIGAATLHPFATLAGIYDSATIYRYAPASGQPPGLSGEVLARLRVGAEVKAQTDSTSVDANLAAGYNLFTGLLVPATRDMSYLSWHGLLDLELNRTGVIGFIATLSSSRSEETSNTVAPVPLLSFLSSARLGAPIRFPGSRVSLVPQVQVDYETFNPLGISSAFAPDITSNPLFVYEMSSVNLNAGLTAQWRFLGNIALVANATFDARKYPFAESSSGSFLSPSSNLPAELFKAKAGAAGLLTRHLSAQLLVGAAADFGGSNSHDFIGQAELGWVDTLFSAHGGYIRTLNPVPLFGVARQNRTYLDVQALALRRLSLHLFGAFDLVEYALSTRSDAVAVARASIDWQALSMLSVGASYRFSFRTSTHSTAGLNFVRHEPMLTLSLSWKDWPDRVPQYDETSIELPSRIEAPRPPLNLSPL
jgi:hypothetical protein